MDFKRFPERIYVDDDFTPDPQTISQRFSAFSQPAKKNFKSMEYMRADLVMVHNAGLLNEEPIEEIFSRLKEIEGKINDLTRGITSYISK
jgi:hypothetical protein